MKKGFTLIELLAVIVILAIIATIATPIVLDIIKDTRESATLRNADYYLNAVEQSIARKSLNTGSNYKPNTCVIQTDGNLLCDGEVVIEVEVTGKKPSGGTITFDKGKINDITLNIENKVVGQNGKGEFVIIQQAGLYDAKGKLIADWNTLVTKYGMDVEKDYSLYSNDSSSPYYVITNNNELSDGVKLIIPNSITKIGDSAFYDCDSLTSVTIGDGVTTIGDSAFYDCDSLTNMTIPNNVTTIGYSAFYGCDSLTSVTIGDSVTTIGSDAFRSCRNLTSVTIGDSVTTIGNSAFIYCNSLTQITVDDNNQHYCDVDGVLFDKEMTRLIMYPSGKTETTYAIPNSITTINTYAFFQCSNLASVTIPNGVTRISSCAFYECTSLAMITFNGTINQWNAISKEGSDIIYIVDTETITCTDGTTPITKSGHVVIPW